MNNFTMIANFIGIIAFSASGSFKGFKYKLDILGIIVLSVITSVGGGIIRDLMLNKVPFILSHPNDIYIATIVAIILFIVTKKKEIISKYNTKLLILDAIGLAIFTIIGSKISMDCNQPLISVAIISTITGVGGGVLRDVLCSEIPIVLKEDVYAVLSFFGSILYYFLVIILNNEFITSVIIFALILTIRLIVIKYKINLPK